MFIIFLPFTFFQIMLIAFFYPYWWGKWSSERLCECQPYLDKYKCEDVLVCACMFVCLCNYLHVCKGTCVRERLCVWSDYSLLNTASCCYSVCQYSVCHLGLLSESRHFLSQRCTTLPSLFDFMDLVESIHHLSNVIMFQHSGLSFPQLVDSNFFLYLFSVQ